MSRLALLALGLAGLAVDAADADDGSAPAFLGDKMPLRVLSVLPATHSKDTQIGGRAALTMVFSRAVIALGEDWKGEGGTNDETKPFLLKACEGKPEFAVPGKFRWATTAIARFDPDLDWPSDLCFQLLPKPGLRTFDGLTLEAKEEQRWTFRTRPVRMHLQLVLSRTASELTGGRWSSNLEDDNGLNSAQECPPDASALLSFTSDLDHDLAFESLQKANSGLLAPGAFEKCGKRCLSVKPRGLEANKRYSIVFPAGGRYLHIAGPAAQEQSVALMGLLPFSFPFWFKEPPKEEWRNHRMQARRMLLYLRHGLQDASSKGISALKSAMEVKDGDGKSMAFELTHKDNATLQLLVPELMPASTYQINVKAADVQDGFGQKLQSCSMKYETEPWPTAFVESDELAHFRHSPGDWTALARGEDNTYEDESSWTPHLIKKLMKSGKRPYEMRAWPVRAEDLPKALAQRFSYNHGPFLPQEEALRVAAPLAKELRALKLQESKLLLGPERTGLFLKEVQRSRHSSDKGFVSVSSFGLAFVTTDSGELLAWATDYKTGSAVAGAAVTVYHVPWDARPENVAVFAKGETAVDGTVAFRGPELHARGQLVALAQRGDGGLAYCENVPFPSSMKRVRKPRGELVTDRQIYRPGDTVHLKGYVRILGANGTGYEMLSKTDGRLQFSLQWKRGHGRQRPSKPLLVDANLVEKYGSVSAELKVPASDEEVTYGRVPIHLLLEGSSLPGHGKLNVASTSITVADPRPPTVALNMSSERKFLLPGPAATLPLKLHAKTYSGTPVVGAEVEVKWRLRRWRSSEGPHGVSDEGAHSGAFVGLASLADTKPHAFVWPPPPRGDQHVAKGTLTVVTEEGGLGTTELRLAELLQSAGENGEALPPCKEGDELEVHARWVGPTREVVTAELDAMPVARSRGSVSLVPARPVDLGAGTPLPGTPFAVFVDVKDHEESVMGTEVTLSLHEWDGKKEVVKDPTGALNSGASKEEVHKAALESGLRPVDSWGSQVGESCVAKSDGGKELQCSKSLTLPAAKKYVVLARAKDRDGVELVTAFAVGKTEEEWQKKPLQSFDAAVTVRSDKSSYAVGDLAKLTLLSPFQDATCLVLWGNGDGKKSKQARFMGPPGKEHSLELDLGSECAYGCNAVVLLAAPDQPKGAVLPVPVQLSPLLDVSLPRTVVSHVPLPVPDTGRVFSKAPLNVSLAVAGKATDVARPGDEAELRVSVPRAEAGAEVCIFVVDKAMLDVGGPANPHPAARLDKSFELRRSSHFSTQTTELASAEGYRQTVATALRRAKLDPFPVDSNFPLKPNVGDLWPVEQRDEDYFAERTDQMTRFPPGMGMGIVLGGFRGGFGAVAENGPALMSMERSAAPMALAAGAAAPMLEVEEDEAEESAPMAPPAPMMMKKAARSQSADAVMVNQQEAAPPGGGKGGGGDGPTLGKEAFTRSQFETTPLFKASAVVGADGKVSVPFHVPDNIATFEVRAYFVDGGRKHRFGRAETKFVSRREVSLMPSVPRVVRPGDRFECGVTVTGHGEGALPDGGVSLLAQLSIGSSVALRSGEAADFAMEKNGDGLEMLLKQLGPGGSPKEVVFPFEAPSAMKGGGLGVSTMRFAATASGNTVDALEANLTVKAQQNPVHISTSLAVAASEEAVEVAEGIDLPAAMPGSGELAVTAGVGYLPSVLADSATLLSRSLDNGEILLAALAPAAALAVYFPTDAAHAPEALSSAATAFQDAMAKLPGYTDGFQGLVWRPEDMIQSFFGRRYVDVRLNCLGLFAAHVVANAAAGRKTGGKGAWASLQLTVPATLTRTWKVAIEREVARQVRELHNQPMHPCFSDCFKDWGELAMVRAVLGHAWVHPDGMVAQEFSMDRLFSKEALDALGPLGLAHAALAYTWHGGEDKERLRDVYQRLAAQVRVQGRTAYVAASLESPHTAGLAANAAVLLALGKAGANALAENFADNAGASLAAKLAAYVADGAGDGRSVRFGGGEWLAPREGMMAVTALAAYDRAHGSARPELTLNAVSGEVKVLDYEAKEAGAPPKTEVLPWAKLPVPPKPLRFTAAGKGQVSIVAALTFVPAKPPTKGAVYRGIYVEKVVRRMDGEGNAVGKPLDLVRLGDSVVVTLQVTTPDDLERVTLQDLAAGGLEPVDPKVAGDFSGSKSSGGCGGRFIWSFWCWPAFSGRETYADRVKWSSGVRLPAGTHSVSYQAVAATRGVFALPPAHAFVEGQPEVMGLSQAGTIVVVGEGCDGSFAGFSDAEPDAILQRLGVAPQRRLAAKGCPGGCPNGGVCQLDTGKCACYKGMDVIDGDCPAEESKAEPIELVQRHSPLYGEAPSFQGVAWGACIAMILLVAAAVVQRLRGSDHSAVQLDDEPGQLLTGGFLPVRDQPFYSLESLELPERSP